MASRDPELRALQDRWTPAWKVWRARRSLDPPGVYDGEFVATRMDEKAGPDRTIMCPTSEELDAALREQQEIAESGTTPLRSGYLE
jgi:hypothetical protein